MAPRYTKFFLILSGIVLLGLLAALIFNNDDKVPLYSTGNNSRVTDTSAGKIRERPSTTIAHARVRKASTNVISLNGAHDLTISHKTIEGGEAACIRLENCYNIHITLNKLWHAKKPGLVLYNCRNIVVDHNFFNEVSTGVYAEKSEEGGIKVDSNEFLNMQGPYPRGQFVQFNAVNGSGCSISYNKCENIFGKSNAEDGISLYKSNGAADSPILIKGNWIRGGGPSKTGGGIMLGDSGGSYLIATENILVNPGQYGIAISGGDHNSIIQNTIYARPQSFTNVGIYVAGYGGANCTNSTVALNKVYYLNSKNQENDSWLGPNADKPLQWETNHWGAPIGGEILPRKIISSK